MNLRRVVSAHLNITILIATSVIHMGIAQAAPAGDPKAGDDVFASECSDCHSVRKGKNKKGPSLFGVVGRKSASIPNYKYTDAMRSYKVVWTPEKIDAYITNPNKVVPGTKMKKYDGLADPKARADVIAYLATKK
jgi:cytochrome c